MHRYVQIQTSMNVYIHKRYAYNIIYNFCVYIYIYIHTYIVFQYVYIYIYAHICLDMYGYMYDMQKELFAVVCKYRESAGRWSLNEVRTALATNTTSLSFKLSISADMFSIFSFTSCTFSVKSPCWLGRIPQQRVES